MKNYKSTETLNSVQSYALTVLDLLEITKNYCETNIEESEHLAKICSIIRITTNEQKTLVSILLNTL